MYICFAEHEETHKYAICCNHGEKRLYLSIEKNSNQVIAKEMNSSRINFFNFLSTENPGEFIIMDYASFEATPELVANGRCYDFWPTPRYLKVKTHLGYNRGPLCMENSVDEYYCRLKLRPRLYRKNGNVTLNDFAKGKDTYYICTAGRYGKTGYLYLRDRGEREGGTVTHDGEIERGPEVELSLVISGSNMPDNGTATESQASSGPARYVTACKPSIKRGNDDDLMLFRLVRYESTYVSVN